MNEYVKKIGSPFFGKELARLKEFLLEQNLSYDESITYTVVLEDDEKIVATGSVEKNILKCIAVSNEYQGKNILSLVVSDLIQHLADKNIFHYFGFTKPANETVFSAMGLHAIVQTDDVLLLENKKNGFSSYLQFLIDETNLSNAKENKNASHISAIVANCNPFTKGHRHLIETAARECALVHLFILSEEQNWITSADRFNMVKDGVRDLENVVVHQTKDYLISPVVFPTYFLKDKASALKINCKLDVKIFCEKIAPALGITKRYVGDEPFDSVTSEYNEVLKEELPKYGIDVNEIARLKIDGEIVSASTVRKSIVEKNFALAKKMLNASSVSYLEKIGVIK